MCGGEGGGSLDEEREIFKGEAKENFLRIQGRCSKGRGGNREGDWETKLVGESKDRAQGRAVKEAPGREEREALGGEKRAGVGGWGQEERMTRGWDEQNQHL